MNAIINLSQKVKRITVVIIVLFVLVVFFLLIQPLKAQKPKIIYEKTFGSPYASFRPNAITIDKEGIMYIIGRYRYSRITSKLENLEDADADTTLPSSLDPSLYIFKVSKEGKMINRTFLPWVIEGIDISITKDNNLLVTGFINNYREKNYEGDRTQGVWAALMNTDFKIRWQRNYPSYYNSVPDKIMETSDGKVLITAHSTIAYSDYFPYDNSRLILLDKNGTLLQDILPMKDIDSSVCKNYPYNQWLRHIRSNTGKEFNDSSNKFFDIDISNILTHSLFCSIEGAIPMPQGILFGGTIDASGNGKFFSEENYFFLAETDNNLQVKKLNTYNIEKPDKYGNFKHNVYGSNIAVNSQTIAMAGINQLADRENLAIVFNKNYDTLFTRHTSGDEYNLPKIAALGSERYAMCNETKPNRLKLLFINTDQSTQEFYLGEKFEIIDFIDIVYFDRTLYIIANARKKEIYQTYLAKVEVN